MTRKEAMELCLPRYETGKPCSRGHIAERYTKGGVCVECSQIVGLSWRTRNPDRMKHLRDTWRNNNREYQNALVRAWGLANADRRKELRRVWLEKNAERERARSAKYRKDNAAKISAYHKARYYANLEAERARSRDYFARKPEIARAAKKRWKLGNPLIVAALGHARRARKLSAGGRYRADDIRRLLLMQKCRCGYCRAPINKLYHIDHILPIALSGTNDPNNLQLLCPSCNYRKGAKHPLEFARQLGRLL